MTTVSFVICNNLNTPQNRVLRTYQLTDTLSWQKGEHRFRFGGEWEHLYGRGSWEYINPAIVVLYDPLHLASLFPLASSTNPVQAKIGQDALKAYSALPDSLKLNATFNGPLKPGLLPTVADLQKLPVFSVLFGIGDGGQPQNYRQNEASHNNRYRLFASDQWRMRSNLTVSYSLAWSFENNLLNHDLDRPAYLKPIFSDLSAPRQDYNNFDPSLGFAWSLRGGKTVIRGGGGLFHDSNLFWTRLVERAYTGPSGNGRYIIPGTFFSPSLDNTALPNPAITGATVINNLPTYQAALGGFFGNGTDLSVRGIERIKTTGDIGFGALYSPDTTIAYSAQTTFGVQHELARNLVVQADFVMRRSMHIGGLFDTFKYDANRYNRAASLGGPIIPKCAGAQALDPKAVCSNGAINISISGANYRYSGLHVKVDKRFSERYLFTGSYALSKYTGFNGVINPDNFFQADGYQGADRRHRFTFSGVMEAPKYGGDNRFLRAAFNTWQVSLISQIVSKPPLTPTISSIDPTGQGINVFELPGVQWNGFGRDIGVGDLKNLVDQYNQTQAGKITPRSQTYPKITLPADFDNGDT